MINHRAVSGRSGFRSPLQRPRDLQLRLHRVTRGASLQRPSEEALGPRGAQARLPPRVGSGGDLAWGIQKG